MVLALALAVGCAGCAVKRADHSSSGAATAHHGKLRSILYINPLPNDPGWDLLGSCMKTEAAKHGISVRVVGPAGGNVNVQEMQNLLGQAVATRAQAIVTWSIGAGAAFDPLFAQARAHDGVIATLHSIGATKNQNFDVGTTVADQARMQIQAVAKRPGHQYVGVVYQRQTGTGYSDYLPALRDEVSKHSNVTLEDVKYDNGKFTDDMAIASRMLTVHPTINVLVNYSGFPGVLTAIREKHLVGKVVAFISPEFPKATVGYINEGLIGGLRVLPHCLEGQVVVQRLIDAWAGRPVAKHYSNGYKYVTGDEYKQLAARGAV